MEGVSPTLDLKFPFRSDTMAQIAEFAALRYMGKELSAVESRIAVIGIVVESEDSVEALNEILHEYRESIIGRMGIPYRRRGINIISIAVDAPQDTISALSGKVGKLPGVSSKTAYAEGKK